MTTPKRVDVLVVGGGLGGLLAAAQAQHRGRSVLVLEQTARPGGLALSPPLAGFPMNLGPHALYLDGASERALRELGLPLTGFSPGAGAHLELDGVLVPLPSTAWGLLSARWLTWRERAELALTLRGLAGPPPSGTVSTWLEGLRSARVRGFCEALLRVTTYTNAPTQLSAGLAWRQLSTLLNPKARGVRYLDGGWQTLVDTLAPTVPVRCHARVSHVSADGVVTLEDEERLQGAEVVLAVPLAAAARLVDDEGLRRRAASAAPVRAACLDVVLGQLPIPDRRLVLGVERPLYFSVHTRPEAKGPIALHLAWYLSPDDAQDASGLRTQLEDFLERVQPGWRNHCLGQRFFPHLRVMDDLPRETVTQLSSPLRLASTVATDRFLFDGAAASVGAPEVCQTALTR